MAGSTFTHGCKFSFPSFPGVILEMPQASPSNMATRCLAPYFAHIIKVKFAHFHPPIIPIKHARHHNSKTRTPLWQFWHFLSAYTSPIRHTSSLTTDHPWYFEPIRPYFLLNLCNSASLYQNKPFSGLQPKIL